MVLLGLVLGWTTAFGAASLAGADGLILVATAPGNSGMQRDAVEISPSGHAPPVGQRLTREITVRPGDTASQIAEQRGITLQALAELNPSEDLSFLLAGQTLRVSEPATVPVELPAEGVIRRLQIWPWPVAQGQTLLLWIQHDGDQEPQLRVGQESVPGWQERGASWFLIPIHPAQSPGALDLEILTGEDRLPLSVEVLAADFDLYHIPASASDPILTEADRVRAEATRVAGVFASGTVTAWGSRERFLAPLEAPAIRTSPFGSRRTYGGSSSVSIHYGEDYAVAAGTPVRAPAPATVILAEELFVRGNAVILDHGSSVMSGYWHLETISVEVGDFVQTGEIIGTVGSTGLSTGAHLHWELHIGGVPVDPLQWLGS